MTDGERLHHAAAAMRAALCDRKMLRFDAPHLIGVVPRAGRVIERIESSGRHLEMTWDDGIVLHTNLRRHGVWNVHRAESYWQGSHRDLRVLVEVPGWVAVCFNAPVVETYRTPDATRHPGLGGAGPDLSRPDADLGRCVEALLRPRDPRIRLHVVLLDQRMFCGLGNVLRSEALWVCELSPFARVGELSEREAVRLVNTAAQLVRASLRTAEQATNVYGRCARPCSRCGESIRSMDVGDPPRSLYWCPGCQTGLDPRRTDDTREIDPHPAAVRYLADLPWRQTG